jgi:hypothetical protein
MRDTNHFAPTPKDCTVLGLRSSKFGFIFLNPATGNGGQRCPGYIDFVRVSRSATTFGARGAQIAEEGQTHVASRQHPPTGSRPEQSRLHSESRHIQTLVFVALA